MKFCMELQILNLVEMCRDAGYPEWAIESALGEGPLPERRRAQMGDH